MCACLLPAGAQYLFILAEIWPFPLSNAILTKAIRGDPRKARWLLARVLWVLGNEDGLPDHERLCAAFETYSENLPVWIWISWIPQLLSALMRPEASIAKNIIIKIVTLYPHVIPPPPRLVIERSFLSISKNI